VAIKSFYLITGDKVADGGVKWHYYPGHEPCGVKWHS